MSESGADMDLEALKAKWATEQRELASRVSLRDDESWVFTGEEVHERAADEATGAEPAADASRRVELRFVGGLDISFIKGNDTDACVALAVFDLKKRQTVYSDCQWVKLEFPYISGFLAFREVPLFLPVLRACKDAAPDLFPQVVLVDGNGLLHPRRFGSACHLGVVAGVPTVGVAKTFLQVGELTKYDAIALSRKGLAVPLNDEHGEQLGWAFRASEALSKPVFVSPGHGVSHRTALEVVRRSCLHRIPEPVRQADLLSRKFLRENPLDGGA
mmetsp:Transcript_4521/g.14597  ORF Transcript_4521/g.14597 Transcript_4521/m.14597 type:complete len:273 (+) Transcript_4521:73-891(+)